MARNMVPKARAKKAAPNLFHRNANTIRTTPRKKWSKGRGLPLFGPAPAVLRVSRYRPHYGRKEAAKYATRAPHRLGGTSA